MELYKAAQMARKSLAELIALDHRASERQKAAIEALEAAFYPIQMGGKPIDPDDFLRGRYVEE